MTALVVGLSHRTAPLAVLERATLDGSAARALAVRACGADDVAEAVVLSTCNRLEVYSEVATFHGGLAQVGAALVEATGVPLVELTDHLYVHYADRAVEHLFTVVCGLDSMAVGESQVLGQVRSALRRGQEDGSVGTALDGLLQRALRVGKRAHSETGLDHAGHSLVEAGLAHADEVVGPLAGARVLVVGAGAMSALAATTAHRLGARDITVLNRTRARAQRLAEAVGGSWGALGEEGALERALAEADVVLSCTGAVGHVVDAATVGAARAVRGGGAPGCSGAAAPQLVVDLALPRDVAPEVGRLPGVVVLGLAELGAQLAAEADGAGTGVAADLRDARAIVAEEASSYLAERRAAAVAPTVVALRTQAREVADAELARLRHRLGPAMDERVGAEVAQTLHRVVSTLLHTPTVRMKHLAADASSGPAYVEAVRELFDLDAAGTREPGAAAQALRAVPEARAEAAPERAGADALRALLAGAPRAVPSPLPGPLPGPLPDPAAGHDDGGPR
ncbi:glutamyl-tRNA reductase [uncultured Pseudokineococcus sp.]|uniref:glutamyl-tRNA reductase n=1 Tax=uncultured Pseudokineococcus sp. TaxID=1642928 RepID=UPI00262AA8DC|nr:glutamyl-tRNA reductase [uncultured Pseudokineococcus sp.]